MRRTRATTANRPVMVITRGMAVILAASGCAALVEPDRPTVAALFLSPTVATLEPGASQQFSVSATLTNGDKTVPEVSYSATGGTVTPGGLYTAGTVDGGFVVRALHPPSGMTAAALVTVAPEDTSLENECDTPRPEWIWCDDFETSRLDSYFEYDPSGSSFERIDAIGLGGSSGMRARWTIGQVNAGSLHLAIGLTPQAYFAPADGGSARFTEIFWRVFLRNQVGWVGGGGDKLSRAIIFASTSTFAQAMIAHVWSGDDGSPYEDRLIIDPARGTDEAGSLLTTGYNDFTNLTFLGLDIGRKPLFGSTSVGQWYCIEARVKLNSAGAADGVMELWIDDVLDASRTGLNFVGNFTAYGINAVYLENFWNAGSPAAQERYLDNFVVSTTRIGCGDQ